MNDRLLVIIGDGGQARVTAEAAKLVGINVHLSLGPDEEKHFFDNIDQIGQYDYIIAIGDNEARVQIIEKLTLHNLNYVNIVHPSAYISPSAKIGVGNFVGPAAIIHTQAVIGHHCIINTGSIIEHDCSIGNTVHIAPASTVTGHVTIEDTAIVGAGAVILPQSHVKSAELVKAGSVFRNAE